MLNSKLQIKSIYQPYSFTAIWLIVILIATCLPGNYIPVDLTFIQWLKPDKIIHCLLFGIFSFLFLLELDYNHARLKNGIKWGLVIVLTLFWAGFTEFLQFRFIDGRDGNLFDFLANVLGCILACSGYGIFNKQKRKKKNKKE